MAFSTSCPAEIASKQGVIFTLVAHTGFEPVISSLRGRCPKPLDECAISQTEVKSSQLGYLRSLSYPVHKGQAPGVLRAIIIPLITLLAIPSILRASIATCLVLNARMVRLNSTRVSGHYHGGYTTMVTYLRMLLKRSHHQRHKRGYYLPYQGSS